MFKRMNALIWLRNQQLLTNKNLLIQILLPIFLLFLYKMMGMNGQSLVFASLSMSLSVAVGVTISTLIAEEKEKKNVKTLLLSGVRYSEYLMSVLFYPILVAVLSIVGIPIIAQVDFSDRIVEYLTMSILIAIVVMLLNLLVGLCSDTQSKSQINSLPIMLLVSFLPLFSSTKEGVKEIVDWTFMGAYTDFFVNSEFSLTSKSIVILLVWVVGLLALSVVALRRNHGQGRKNLLTKLAP